MDLSNADRSEIIERVLNMQKLYDEQAEQLKEAKLIINLCRYNFSQTQLSFKNGYDLCAAYLNDFEDKPLPTYEEIT